MSGESNSRERAERGEAWCKGTILSQATESKLEREVHEEIKDGP